MTGSPSPLPLLLLPVEVLDADRGLNERARSIFSTLQSEEKEGLYARLLQRLEDRFEKQSVGRVTAGLALARNGLTIDELMLVSGRSERRVKLLLESLRNHTSATSGHYALLQPELGSAAVQRYLPADEQRRTLHLRLAHCYAQGPLSRRRLLEEPWHFSQARAWGLLRDFLTEIPVIMAFDNARALDVLRGYWIRLADHADPAIEYRKSIRRCTLTGHHNQHISRAHQIIIHLLGSIGREAEAAQWRHWAHRHSPEKSWSYSSDVPHAQITPVYMHFLNTSYATAPIPAE